MAAADEHGTQPAEQQLSAAIEPGSLPSEGSPAATDEPLDEQQEAPNSQDGTAEEHPNAEPAAVPAADELQHSAMHEEQHDEQQHNFALAKDGAKVLAANKEAKKPQALLDDDSDTFMKNDCRVDKWVMLELSQVAKVSRVELQQYELYSARVREFEAWGRQSHPRSDGYGSEYARTLNSSQWQLLGNFTAEKAKGSQLFTVERPLWARYLLLRFVSQHGPEAICALNGISLFGKSAVEELEDQLASASEEGLDLRLPLEIEAEQQQAEAAAAAAAAAPTAAAAASTTGLASEQLRASPSDGDAETAASGGAAGDAGARGSVVETEGAAASHGPPPEPVEGAAAPLDHQQQAQAQTAALESDTAAGGASAVAAGADVELAPAPSGDAPTRQPSAAEAAISPGADGSTAGSANESMKATNSSGSGSDSELEVQPLDGDVAVPAAAADSGTPEPSQPGSATTSPQAVVQAVPENSTDSAMGSVTAANTSAEVQEQQQQQDVASTTSTSIKAAAEAAAGQALIDMPPTSEGPSSQDASVAAGPPPAVKPAVPAAQAGGSGPSPSPAPVSAPPASAPAPPAAPLEGLELPLAGLGGKAKGGGSVYDFLVQEIRTAKLQHKLIAKTVLELQRNATAQYAELSGDVASLAAALSKIPTDHRLGDEELAVRVDALVKAHMLHVASQMVGLQEALASSAKQQHALLCFLAMMGGVLALNGTRFAQQWPRAKYVVLLLAAANGLVGVALQLQGSMAQRPSWMHALPWGVASA
ncbi:hypothetical protein D9Q98_006126 [Chlorella vulgaris]|uniref:SUN domain-containing protein n=1 Tax=Chlorella vulgaris TaxID=3077 RepID=A0A9D4Z122_CHLVU|nr:hypothetical protein D9Q98_006126 [Chlorella vulgaris]